jgi:hypothetical protein
MNQSLRPVPDGACVRSCDYMYSGYQFWLISHSLSQKPVYFRLKSKTNYPSAIFSINPPGMGDCDGLPFNPGFRSSSRCAFPGISRARFRGLFSQIHYPSLAWCWGVLFACLASWIAHPRGKGKSLVHPFAIVSFSSSCFYCRSHLFHQFMQPVLAVAILVTGLSIVAMTLIAPAEIILLCWLILV